jgi:hypothetical protein
VFVTPGRLLDLLHAPRAPQAELLEDLQDGRRGNLERLGDLPGRLPAVAELLDAANDPLRRPERHMPRSRGAILKPLLALLLESPQPLVDRPAAHSRGLRRGLHRPALLTNPAHQQFPARRGGLHVRMKSHLGVLL